MGVASASFPVRQEVSRSSNLWLRSRGWDLAFITFSVILVPLPYLVYLFVRQLGVSDDVSRNAVNGFVAIAVGGPHMMSTFLRTGLDRDFTSRYPMLIRSSIIIPIVVVSLAFLNLELLLTIFFFWASLHVLHQVTYIVELYNHKEHKFVRPSAVSLPARLIDYAVIMTCLFPFAALKISQGAFEVGTNDLTRVIPEFFQQTWFFVFMSAIFGVAVVAFLIKSVIEYLSGAPIFTWLKKKGLVFAIKSLIMYRGGYLKGLVFAIKSLIMYRGGYLNWPKTIFLLLTVVVAFIIPALPNLDTAFQGMNTWHSFQYLAITFYIIKIRQQYGGLDQAPIVARFAKQAKDSRGLFALSTMMLVGSLIVFIVVYALAGVLRPGIDGNAHFDIAYYTAILSFLWIHYYHDHFLFTNFEALDQAYGEAK